MTRETNSFDITQIPELARLAREVNTSKRPVRLTDEAGTVAVLVPAPAPRARRGRRRTLTEADRQAFLDSAGSWKGNVDVERLKEGLAQSRRIPPRPLPDL